MPTRLPDLPAATDPERTDLVYVTSDNGGGIIDTKMTIAQVLAADGLALDARDYGVYPDGLDQHENMEVALQAAVDANKPLRLPPGQIHIQERIIFQLAAGQTLRMISDGGTEIFLDNANGVSWSIRGTLITDTVTLAADASRGDNYIDLSDITGIDIGNVIFLKSTETPETAWSYNKSCVRRISHIDGTRVWLSQDLDWDFTIAEMDIIEVYPETRFEMENIDVLATGHSGVSGAFTISNGTSALLRNGKVHGTTEYGSGETSDGLKFTSTMDVVVENYEFKSLRYPGNTGPAHNVIFRNIRAENVRHIDFNNWCSDCMMEDVWGVDTDALIQCHPCIRPTFRRVRDAVTDDVIVGIDVRGFGETIEDCQVTTNRDSIGTGTMSVSHIQSAYEPMALEFTRRVKNVFAPWTGITLGKEGLLIVEECDIGMLGGGLHSGAGVIQVDEATRVRNFEPGSHDPSARRQFDKTLMLGRKPTILPVLQYRTVVGAANNTITGATQADPCVITAVAHGYSNGDVVWINGVGGMSELDETMCKVANATTDTFEITDLDDVGIDATGFTAYTSGGVVTEKEEVTTMDPTTDPVCGRADRLRFECVVVDNRKSGTTGSTSYVEKLKYQSFDGGSMSQQRFYGIMKIWSFVDNDFCGAEYRYHYNYNEPVFKTSSKVDLTPSSDCSVAATFHAHYLSSNEDEGASSGVKNTPYGNCYMGIDVTTTAASSVDDYQMVVIEIEEWTSEESPIP